MKSISLALPVLLLLAACDNGTQRADGAAEETLAENGPTAPSPSPPVDAESPIPTQLPAALQGRWGLVPADCDPARDDAKGLLTITADELEFYESVGTLGTITEAEPTRIRAAFDFEGEGMTWQRELVLDVQDDGATLIRREFGEDAAPEPFRYAKCK